MPVYGSGSASGPQKKRRKAKRKPSADVISGAASILAKGKPKKKRRIEKSIKREGNKQYRRDRAAQLKRIRREMSRPDYTPPVAVTTDAEGRATIPADLSSRDIKKLSPLGLTGEKLARKSARRTKAPSNLEFGVTILTGGRSGAAKSVGKAIFGTAKAAGGKAKAAAKAVPKVAKAPAKARRKVRAPSERKAAKAKVEAKKHRPKKPSKDAPLKKKAASKKAQAKLRYTKPERKLRRAKRVQKATKRATSIPTAVGAGALAGTPEGRALVEGHVKAGIEEPVKTAKTTARALAAAFALPVQLAGAGIEEAKGKEGSLDRTTGEIKEGFKEMADDLLSGDADRVQKSVEEDVGFALGVPILKPVTAGAKAAGKGVKGAYRVSGAKKAVGKLDKKLSTPGAGPGRARATVQKVTQRKGRRVVAKGIGRNRHAGEYQGAARGKAMRKKAKGTLRDASRNEAAGVVAELGIERGPQALSHLKTIRKNREKARSETSAPVAQRATVADAIKVLEKNPKLLESKKFWKHVDEIKTTLRSPKKGQNRRAALLNQATVLSEITGKRILKPHERISAKAEKLSGVTERTAAWGVVKAKQKQAKAHRAEARKAAARTQGAKGSRHAETQAKVTQLRREAQSLTNNARVLREKVRARGAMLRRKIRKFKRPETRARKLEEARRADTILNRQLDQILEMEANARGKLAEAKGLSRRVKNLKREQFVHHRAEAKRLRADALDLQRELAPFSRGDRKPTTKARRPHHSKEMLDAFERDVKAARKEAGGFGESVRFPERVKGVDEQMTAGTFEAGVKPRHQNIKTGEAFRKDIAERHFDDLVHNVHTEFTRRGVARGMRKVVKQLHVPKRYRGKKQTVFTGPALAELAKGGKFNPKTEVALPARDISAALKGEHFDLTTFQSKVTEAMTRELDSLKDVPGSKYTIIPREAGREILAQLAPGRSRGVLQGASSLVARTILFSPAWLAAQGVNTALQAMGDMRFNPVAAGRAAWNLERLRFTNRPLFEEFMGRINAASPLVDMPGRSGVLPTKMGKARSALRGNVLGRAIDDATHARTFGVIDRTQAAHWKGYAAMRRVLSKRDRAQMRNAIGAQNRLSNQLKGKSQREARDILLRKEKLVDDVVEGVSRTTGDWLTYSRLERSVAAATIFYPFVRMSLTWPGRFAKEHPVVATALYLTAQVEADLVEKFLDQEDVEFLDYARPVIFSGKDEAFQLTGGHRFVSPALNVFTETVGEALASGDDDATAVGLARGINPVVALPFQTLMGVDGFGNKMDVGPLERLGYNVSSLIPFARRAGVPDKFKPPSEISQAYRDLDPKRLDRSVLNPLIGLDQDAARQMAQIRKAFSAEEWDLAKELLGIEDEPTTGSAPATRKATRGGLFKSSGSSSGGGGGLFK